MNRCILLPIAAVLLLSGIAFAQWTPNPAINTEISTAVESQWYPEILRAPSGEVLVVWHDFRPGGVSDMYIQRLNSGGFPLWTPDGVPLSTAPGHQWGQQIATDGADGAIVAWHDERAGSSYFDIYAQRIGPAGMPLWTPNGVPICTSWTHEEWPAISSDGGGGAFIAWGGHHLKMQRVNASGTPQWAMNGIVLIAGTGMHDNRWPKTVPDDSGGVFVAWQHFNGTDWDIHAQRVSATGAPLWTAGGVVVTNLPSYAEKPSVVSDGTGGFIVTWEDARSGSWDIYAQRLNKHGAALWTANGVPVVSALNDQRVPLGDHGTVSVIETDGAGGAIIAWQDGRSGPWAIYAQRLNGSGAPQWALNGVALSSGSGNAQHPVIASDDSGGAVIGWEAEVGGGSVDLYAQRLGPSGAELWNPGGIPVSTAPGIQNRPRIFSGGGGPPFMAWQDSRSGTSYDIFAQKIDPEGSPPPPPPDSGGPHLMSVTDIPNDQGGVVSLVWQAIHLDTNTTILPYYSIWRAIPSGGPTGKSRRLAIRGVEYDWEWIANQPAHRFSSYAYSAPTLYDSTAGADGKHYFLVSAHTNNPNEFYDSNVDSGYSVDNLPPAALQNLAHGFLLNTVRLQWSPLADPDLLRYEVYRDVSPIVNPGSLTPYALTVDTSFVDAAPIASAYYLVRGEDIHGNRGPGASTHVQLTEQLIFEASNGWNLVSVPAICPDYDVDSVFPTAISDVFAYDGEYLELDSLENGPGYWVKVSGAQSIDLTGVPIGLDSVPVKAGWNMVGSISTTIPVSSVTSIPGGIITSQFFAYSGGYHASTLIQPGRGYWMKSQQAGTIVLSSGPQMNPAAALRIVPTEELPPPPPGISTGGPGDVPAGLPEDYRLFQNYPNPFNPSTTIRFGLPVAGLVRITVHDMLGREVAILVNGMREAGYLSVAFEAAGLPSGAYACRMQAGGRVLTMKMLMVR